MIVCTIIDNRRTDAIIRAAGLTMEEIAEIDKIVTAARKNMANRSAEYVGPRHAEISELGRRLTEQNIRREMEWYA